MTAPLLRRILASEPEFVARRDELCRRGRLPSGDDQVEAEVRAIVAEVRARGDRAVREYTERFDHRAPDPATGSYERSAARRDAEAARVDPEVARALERAAERIAAFHRPQKAEGYQIDGGALALRVVPLDRVGIYAPGGTARYPSSVLMAAVPARIAGVGEIVLTTPGASPETLLAARLAGVHRVFEIGGAQAIAALAHGTETVPRVDKIVGPGNQWVAAAKRLVYGLVDIDSVAGPSEVLIVADDSADPAWIAADLLAQAEHDVEAHPVLVVLDEVVADAVDRALAEQLPLLPRATIARAALERHGACVVVSSIEEALALVDDYAPEHLELAVAGADALAARVRHAGAIFVGTHSPEAAGDYLAGPNHVLPTGGCARYASPLGVYDFVKHISVIRWSRADLERHWRDIARLAEVEGLAAHGRSAAIRFPGGNDE
ncbi:MAG TPA: histidinol dehydrogenase [Kofleriaceae bacterium]|nr:histidinol dehydrogenase [Kofleriaceae bacterium]